MYFKLYLIWTYGMIISPVSEKKLEGANFSFEDSSESRFYSRKWNFFLSQLASQRHFKYSYYQILSTSVRNYLNFPICSLKSFCRLFSYLPVECRMSCAHSWIYSGSRNTSVWFQHSQHITDKNTSSSQHCVIFSGKSFFASNS